MEQTSTERGEHTPGPWSYEVHELSTGYSAIVYDERGQAIADHLPEDIAALIAASPALLSALEEIANPIAAMQRKAVAEGRKLSGMAYQIANDPEYLKGIARAAITKAVQS